MNDYAITVSAEYLDPIKDALYCEAPASRVRRSVQTAVYEIVRTMSSSSPGGVESDSTAETNPYGYARLANSSMIFWLPLLLICLSPSPST